MPAYGYKGLDFRGKAVSGLREAENPRSARALLRKEGIYVTEVHEASQKGEAGKGLKKEVDFKGMFDRVRIQDVAGVTRQLGTLLRAGVPPVYASELSFRYIQDLPRGRHILQIHKELRIRVR